MSSNNLKSSRSGRSGNNRILYDAHGTRVKSSIFSNKLVRFLLFYVIPYFVINGIILLLVCSTPSIEVKVKNTDNYVTTEVEFTVKSLLPIKELEVSLESEPIEFEKSRSTYTCTVDKNGTFAVEAKSINGMVRSNYTDISMLDDTAPSVDESTIGVNRGTLSFTINDTQSGVNFDSIYGVVNGTDTIYPTSCDKSLGLVTMELPKYIESLELHFEDMVGNARSGKISVTVVEDDGSSAESAESSDSAEETEKTE